MTDAAPITPFTIAVPQAELDDLADRLRRTRWPEAETTGDWNQGAPLGKVRALCDHWLNGYDWRRCERALNALPQFRTEIDGLGIHFAHIRSPEPGALPLLMTHGWPGSIIEFMKVVGPLTDPAAHGGDPVDAFHLILPSLPGYGFSDKPTRPGWTVQRIAAAWGTLMQRLGYDRWVAQGGDWGSIVTRLIGETRPEGCAAIHLNMVMIPPLPEELADLTPTEQSYLAKAEYYREWDSGYAKQQGTRPQTLGYGLTDSPVGQASWIYEKLQVWTDNDGAVESILSPDEMLDNIMLYWLTRSGASSGRLYWESLGKSAVRPASISLPAGFSLFPGDIILSSRRWVERAFTDIIYWSQPERGGHFAAWEQPALFAEELRRCFRQLR